MDERAERIARAAQAVRDAEVPDKLNRWLTMTPDELASMLDRNERSPAMMTIKTNESRGRLPVPPPRSPEDSASATPFSQVPAASKPPKKPVAPASKELQPPESIANTTTPPPASDPAAKPKESTMSQRKAPKTSHPADQADLAKLANATGFVTSLFLGTGNYDKLPADNLATARANCDVLLAKHPTTSRKPLIYATMASGPDVLVVPESYGKGKSAKAPAAPKTSKAAKPAKAAKAPKAPKAAKPAKAKPTSAGERSRYDWKTAEEKAKAGHLPPPPDFSAPTHDRFREVLSEVVKAAKAKDAAALRKIKVNPVSSSPKAVERYRKLCLTALSA